VIAGAGVDAERLDEQAQRGLRVSTQKKSSIPMTMKSGKGRPNRYPAPMK
jgi:hypothetical protein